MNKFLKGCLIAVVILIILGTILGGIGWALGGNRQINSMIYNGEMNYGWNWNIGRGGEHLFFEYNENDDTDFEENWDESEILSGNVEKRYIASASNISELQIEIGGGEFYIAESDNNDFYVESKTTGKYRFYIEQNKLVIEGLRKIPANSVSNRITLFIPKGIKFQEADIALGGAYVSIDAIQADDLDISAGAGRIQVASLTANEMALEVGAGEFSVKNAEVGNVSFELGVGQLSFEGNILGDINADCAMGSMKLLLEGNETDYNYNIDGAIGNIRIGDSNQSGFGMSRKIDNNAAKTCYLQCGVGNMEIDFE